MKIRLLAPPLENSYHVLQPLGLMSTFQYVRHSAKVDFVDLSTSPLSAVDDQLQDKVDILALSCSYTNNILTYQHIIRRVRFFHPDTIIVCGGNHVTFDSEGVLRAGADLVIRHEGERAFADLIRILSESSSPDWRCCPNAAYLENDTVIQTPLLPFVENLDDLPFPDVSIARFPRSFLSPYKKPMLAETSRGCRGHCSFCSSSPMWQRRWRTKFPERVSAEFSCFAESGVDYVILADDNFTVDSARAMEVCQALLSTGNKIPWASTFDPEAVLTEPELAPLMVAAGGGTAYLSLDNANDRISRKYRRPHPIDIWEPAVQRLRECGFSILLHALIGYPEETEEEMRNTIETAMRCGDILFVGILEPRPGSEIWVPRVYEKDYPNFSKGRCLLHPNPRMVEALQFHYMAKFYSHPRRLFSSIVNKHYRYYVIFLFYLSIVYMFQELRSDPLAFVSRVLKRIIPWKKKR
jgi:anaerobic magnesium-protoporphyrin IX monomethyl ester cyclase